MTDKQAHCPVCNLPLTKPAFPTRIGEETLQQTVFHGDWEIEVPMVVDDPMELLFQKLRERHEHDRQRTNLE